MAENRVETLFQDESTLTTSEKILDVAIDLISKEGFDAVSIREIAKTVGIRESSIYNHFRSKDEILDTIIDYLVVELARASAPALDIEAQLEEVGVEKYMEIGSKAFMERIMNPRVTKMWRVLSIELYHNEKIKDFFIQTMLKAPLDGWEQIFGKMIEKKLIKPYDPRMLAREFFSFGIYLYFVQFLLKYDENSRSFDDKALKELDDHIKFFIEAVKA
jgi:AcrR family transcriptional regulator